MLSLGTVLENIWGSITRPVDPQENLFWLFFLSAAGMAFIIYWRRHDKEHISFRGFLSFCFPRRIYEHPSAKLDFKYAVINLVVQGTLVTPLFLISLLAADGTLEMMIFLFGIPEAPLAEGF